MESNISRKKVTKNELVCVFNENGKLTINGKFSFDEERWKMIMAAFEGSFKVDVKDSQMN